MNHEKIAVLDFGGQYAHLIANRVRRLGVYSEIRDSDTPAKELRSYKGIILSGGPMSVYAPEAPHCDPKIFELGVPVFGICYGHQLIQHLLGGQVVSGGTKEYGFADVTVSDFTGLFEGAKNPLRVWMSHGDTVAALGPGFHETAFTSDCRHSAVADDARRFYGVQFHPEVTHTPFGMTMFDHFLKICGVARDWSIEEFIREEVAAIKKKVGDHNVFLLVSGGVDSTVAFALLEKALGKKRVHGLLVDHGLMRKEEAAWVKRSLAAAGFDNLAVVDKSDEFLGALAGVYEPEAKRRIIGDLFWKVKEDVAAELGLNPEEWIMGQGTIYPDTIETGGTKHADTIKTHHNRVDLVQKMIAAGKVVEPLAQLYKDEVRTLGRELGLPEALVQRQPFPGPGLGVRLLCAAQDVAGNQPGGDAIFDFAKTLLPLRAAAILPAQSVGVQGDERTYRHPAVLWTDSRDWDILERVSTGITNRFRSVNRVLLCLAGEPGEFHLKKSDIIRARVSVLQSVDDQVARAMAAAPSDYDIWQFPVVLVPTSTKAGQESIVLRPVVSTEAMTASFARIDFEILMSLARAILAENASISHVFYDLTHKPPGTIEWE